MAQHREGFSLGPLTNIVTAVTHVATGLIKAPVAAANAAVHVTATGVGTAVTQVTDLPIDAVSAVVDGIVSKVVAGVTASIGVAFLVNKLKVPPAAASVLPGLAGAIAIAVVHEVEQKFLHPKAPTPTV